MATRCGRSLESRQRERVAIAYECKHLSPSRPPPTHSPTPPRGSHMSSCRHPPTIERARATIRARVEWGQHAARAARLSLFGQRAHNFFPAHHRRFYSRDQQQTFHSRSARRRPQDEWVSDSPSHPPRVCWFSHRKRTTNNNNCPSACEWVAGVNELRRVSFRPWSVRRRRFFSLFSFSGLRPRHELSRGGAAHTQPIGVLALRQKGVRRPLTLYHPSWLTLGPSMDAARDFESLQIKTKSIEQTLLPLVKQVGPAFFGLTYFFVNVSICTRGWYQQVIINWRGERKASESWERRRADWAGFWRDIFNLSRRHTETLSLWSSRIRTRQWQCPPTRLLHYVVDSNRIGVY